MPNSRRLASSHEQVSPDFAPLKHQLPLRLHRRVRDPAEQLRLLGADTVVLDPFNGHPDETLRPEAAWQALATVWARTRHLQE